MKGQFGCALSVVETITSGSHKLQSLVQERR